MKKYVLSFQYHIHSFVHETNISQSSHQEEFLWFYFYKIDNIAGLHLGNDSMGGGAK